MFFSSIGVGNDNKIRFDFEIASLILVVAEKFPFFLALLNISSYPGSSFNGKFSALIESTNFSLISTPIVCSPALANDNAVGRPILPIPTTQTFKDLDSREFLTSSILFISIFFEFSKSISHNQIVFGFLRANIILY